jgi:hypothetical protein
MWEASATGWCDPSPEDINLTPTDPWAGLGLDAESLEAKVVSPRRDTLGFACNAANPDAVWTRPGHGVMLMLIHSQEKLEKENAELESRGEERIEEWKRRLEGIRRGEGVAA